MRTYPWFGLLPAGIDFDLHLIFLDNPVPSYFYFSWRRVVENPFREFQRRTLATMKDCLPLDAHKRDAREIALP
jgi:hypothetical protein